MGTPKPLGASDAARWSGLGVMPDDGKTKALSTASRRRRRPPSDTLVEFGLGLSGRVPVRRPLGRLVPGGRSAGGRGGSPSAKRICSTGTTSVMKAMMQQCKRTWRFSAEPNRCTKLTGPSRARGEAIALFDTMTGAEDEVGYKRLRQSETTGRPSCSEEWLGKLEKMTGRALKSEKRGPKRKTPDDDAWDDAPAV